MRILNVGIIDDDESKITMIMAKLEQGMELAKPGLREKYDDIKLNPVHLQLNNDINLVLDEILEQNIKALIVDYKLSSYATSIEYTGVTLAKEANLRFYDFPIFILTSFESELFLHENFHAYQVFDVERYLGDADETSEINMKIIEQCLLHERQIEEWKLELEELVKHEGESVEIDSRILELDDLLEKSFDGRNALPKKLKLELSESNVEKLLDALNQLIIKEG